MTTTHRSTLRWDARVSRARLKVMMVWNTIYQLLSISVKEITLRRAFATLLNERQLQYGVHSA